MVEVNSIKSMLHYELECGRGYYSGFKLEPKEVDLVKNLIIQQWIAIIKQYDPLLWQQFAKRGIEKYHELSHLLNHELIWKKSNRKHI